MKTFLILVLIGLWTVGCGRSSHPRDKTLIENFDTHRKQFDQLLEMFQKDQELTRVFRDYTEPEDPSSANVSSARIAEYRRLLKEVHLLGMIKSVGSLDVDFYASAQGLSVSGSGKGYLYDTRPQEPILESLDNYIPPKDVIRGYRSIAKNWYLWQD